jgi:hypothetical protein
MPWLGRLALKPLNGPQSCAILLRQQEWGERQRQGRPQPHFCGSLTAMLASVRGHPHTRLDCCHTLSGHSPPPQKSQPPGIIMSP